MVLRKAFGPKGKAVIGEWRELHDEEFRDLYFSPNIIQTTKSRGIRGAGHVERRGDVHAGFWWADQRERACLEDFGVDGSVVWKRILSK
jgi:hypothetical protein